MRILTVSVGSIIGGTSEVTLDPSTTIAQAGTYSVNLTVTDDDTGETAEATGLIIVDDAALQVTGAPPPIYEPAGQSFTATIATVSNGNANLQGSNLEATVDWGDNTAPSDAAFIPVSGSPGTYSVQGTHTYANPSTPGNPYDVVVYVDEASNPNNFDSGETAIDTSLPTISVTENGSAKEADGANSMETFTFIRNNLNGTLTVPLNIGGTAVEGTNYTFANNSGGGFANDTLTFANMQSTITVKVVPIDDQVPGWTKTVTVTIAQPSSGNNGGSGGGGSGGSGSGSGGSGSGGSYGSGGSGGGSSGGSSGSGSSPPTYQVDPNKGSATGAIGDSDLAVTLGGPGDGSSPTIMGSANGDQNLMELVLSAPYITLPGQAVTLSVSRPDIVRVWDKQPDGTMDPIIGTDSTYTWTYSADGSTNFVPPLLYVGAVDGSSVMGDVKFTLTDSDLQSTVEGATGSSPPRPTTYNDVQSNAGQAVRLYIKSNDDPNSVRNTADWSGLTQTWYVGQYVDLVAEIHGPEALTIFSAFTWNVPGAPLSDYKISGTSAYTVPLTTENTRQPEVQFLWPVAWGGSETDTVTVTAAGLSLPTGSVSILYFVR